MVICKFFSSMRKTCSGIRRSISSRTTLPKWRWRKLASIVNNKVVRFLFLNFHVRVARHAEGWLSTTSMPGKRRWVGGNHLFQPGKFLFSRQQIFIRVQRFERHQAGRLAGTFTRAKWGSLLTGSQQQHRQANAQVRDVGNGWPGSKANRGEHGKDLALKILGQLLLLANL